ncbi:winged helix-turn-helix transcriptional regulator [Paenibacillus sedimenti]|uniref:Helix-turn-helix transcriptional regulator n=1 Tax=Paenibacillus sedimenti TaxID=2770274 RepID=A0A926KRZ3_9BACL|nr:helix-turn-helix domain-containing protein [Paenibacillus sedimenti]MBD0380975.1 helix-turn-helix transcriptional regulator [Paenibacillus sedimenti]
MDNCNNEKLNCPIFYTLSVISGKWKWAILFFIAKEEVIRYGKIKEYLPPIAHKTLSQQLKELEGDGIIHREQYIVMPPKVEYTLTEKGKSLVPMLDFMFQWGEKWID